VVELIALSVFVCITLLTFGLVSWLNAGRNATTKRLMTVTGRMKQSDADLAQEEASAMKQAKQAVSTVGSWAEDRFPKEEKDKSDLVAKLSYAGIRGPQAIAFYQGTRMMCALLLFVPAFVYWSDQSMMNRVSMGVMAGMVGFYAPGLVISRKVKKRVEKIRKSLPDCLDTLVTCVGAGLGLNAAIDRIANERSAVRGDVMGAELKYMTYELQAGIPRDVAFHNLGDRNGVDDLQALAAFMVQSEKLGTGLSEALGIYADELRTRRRQRAQEQANKAAVKLLFPLVFFIFPTMFLVILGPAMMSLKESFGGIGR
jgi:tight adherence protein C